MSKKTRARINFQAPITNSDNMVAQLDQPLLPPSSTSTINSSSASSTLSGTSSSSVPTIDSEVALEIKRQDRDDKAPPLLSVLFHVPKQSPEIARTVLQSQIKLLNVELAAVAKATIEANKPGEETELKTEQLKQRSDAEQKILGAPLTLGSLKDKSSVRCKRAGRGTAALCTDGGWILIGAGIFLGVLIALVKNAIADNDYDGDRTIPNDPNVGFNNLNGYVNDVNHDTNSTQPLISRSWDVGLLFANALIAWIIVKFTIKLDRRSNEELRIESKQHGLLLRSHNKYMAGTHNTLHVLARENERLHRELEVERKAHADTLKLVKTLETRFPVKTTAPQEQKQAQKNETENSDKAKRHLPPNSVGLNPSMLLNAATVASTRGGDTTSTAGSTTSAQTPSR